MLSLRNVVTQYGAIRALKGVSMDVAEGEIVALIGANGAGKTTALKTISGLLPLTEGAIVFDGANISKSPPEDIVKMGVCHLPEGRRVFSQMTVLENLELGAYSRPGGRSGRQQVRKDLEWVFTLFPKLSERTKQLAGTLSGGEQQMLAMGRGLMSKPKVLLMDEPSMGLAPMVVSSLFRVIREINQSGTTILLVEQNAFLALNTATRAYVIETGEISFHGKAKELLNNDEVRKAYLGE